MRPCRSRAFDNCLCLPSRIEDRRSTVGLYVHVPFCAASCPYCDYPHVVSPSPEAHDSFVEALCREIRRRARGWTAHTVETIYVGGGTPSRLSEAHLERIFDALRAAFDAGSVREITVEGNPEDARPSWLRVLRRLGANRLSLGVQSFFDEDLHTLGRRHAAAASARAVALAREAGFENISLDLLFGLPAQPMRRWQATLDEAVRLRPAHVTLYRLTAEAGTSLGERVHAGAASLPGGEHTAAQYERALDVLEEAGFALQEQTHLARPGFEAVHMRRPWRHRDVLGFGPGARSLFWNSDEDAFVSRVNASDERAYTRAAGRQTVPHVRDLLPPPTLADAYLATRLRTAAGLSLDRLATRYGRDLREERGPTLERLVAEGYLERRAGRIRPTRAGRLRLDALTTALV